MRIVETTKRRQTALPAEKRPGATARAILNQKVRGIKYYMFDVMSYADRNDVEVSIRRGHDGRTEWEIFLRDRKLGITEFTRIIDIEIKDRLDQDAYLELRCEEMMDKIRSARIKTEYKEIETKEEAAAEAMPLFLCA